MDIPQGSMQSIQNLSIVYQNLMELVRMHPEDNHLYNCFVEAEHQMIKAWLVYDKKQREFL